MSLGLRLSDHIYNMKLYESIEYLKCFYFRFSTRKMLQELLTMMEETKQYNRLYLLYKKDHTKNMAGRSLVRYMFDKLLMDDKTECIVPLILLTMMEGTRNGITVARLLGDLKMWVQRARDHNWISRYEYHALMTQRIGFSYAEARRP